MSLTKKEIENMRGWLGNRHGDSTRNMASINKLCDMALSALQTGAVAPLNDGRLEDERDIEAALSALPETGAGEAMCGACGQPWTGEKCGQANNDHPFPVCYPVERPTPPQSSADGRQQGHSALRARNGQIERFDPHPQPSAGALDEADEAHEYRASTAQGDELRLANHVIAYFDPGYENRHYYQNKEKLLQHAENIRSAPAAGMVSEWQARAERAEAEVDRLNSLINTPQTADFFEAVKLEAAHQQDRWGTENDAGKEPHDWFWLLGYLSGKSVAAFLKGDPNKGLHHIISSGAVLLNWHRYVTGELIAMRPGIEPPLAPTPGSGEKPERRGR